MGARRPLNAWAQPFRYCPAVIFDESARARPNERAGDGVRAASLSRSGLRAG